MVAWYDPTQLLATGVQTVLSLVFGERADFRLLEAVGARQPPFDYRGPDELWIDYVADIGDGFDSTYAVARLIAEDQIALGGDVLPRAKILVFGGDPIYPTPSRRGYKERTTALYASALPASEVTGERPHAFAVPGNHDGYDGLARFMGVFCSQHPIGAWETRQSKSYFALQLPQRTWLLGVDVQLGSDIDTPQIEYFDRLGLEEGDRVILCTPEPSWIFGEAYDAKHHRNLDALIDKLHAKKARVVARIAGDLHHYRRHQLVLDGESGALGDVHLITAGGGGAFLHPTHTHRVREIDLGREGRFRGMKSYPPSALSRMLGAQNLWFPLKNPWFGVVTAVAYAILSWVMPIPEFGGAHPVRKLLIGALRGMADSPSSLVWFALVLLAFVAFTDTHNKVYRWIAGPIHGALHLTAALLTTAAAREIVLPPLRRAVLGLGWVRGLGQEDPTAAVGIADIADRIATTAAALAGGYVLGSMLMGLYLTLSVCVFGRHYNEAFSSLQIDGYKNFLRMRLHPGGLTIWAIGLDRVPRDWDWDPATRRWELGAGEAIVPHLIERIDIPADVREARG